MSGNAESAFLVYLKKRKNMEQGSSSKKRKKGHSQRNEATNQKDDANDDTTKVLKKQSSTRKCTLKVGVKNQRGVTKAGNLKIFKNNFSSSAKKANFVQKRYNTDETRQENKTDDFQDIHNVLKLKNNKSKVSKSKQGKNKNKMSFNKTKKSSTKNHEKQQDSNSSNYIINHIGKNKNAAWVDNPLMRSQSLFAWLISPMKMEDFFLKNWEKLPVHLKRNNPNYYGQFVSTSLLDQVLRNQNVFFDKNIDITSYIDGKRQTLNPSGRALPHVVWDYYQNNCSVRMLNPQTFMPSVHAVNAALQEFFGCFVGANLYLTPPNSQGFAPHYDDIEAFILQLEGKKRWRLYNPPSEHESLARYSSRNFEQSEIGTPILDTIVNAGDLLYFPRGTIHQGLTIDDTHSLHVTLSVYQRNSWCDFLEKLLPQALQQAAATNVDFRKGLPLNYLKHVGSVNDKNSCFYRKNFKNNLKNLLIQLTDYIDMDSTADLMAKNHIYDFLPPVLTLNEAKCSVGKGGNFMIAEGIVVNSERITIEMRIRLSRSHCIRLIKEDGTHKIYYSTENSKEYHEYELQSLEVDEKFVSSIKSIITSYPNFIYVKELPIDDVDEKIQLVNDLWEKNLIITDVPLSKINYDKK